METKNKWRVYGGDRNLIGTMASPNWQHLKLVGEFKTKREALDTAKDLYSRYGGQMYRYRVIKVGQIT